MMMHDDQQRDKYEYMAIGINGVMMKSINLLVVVIVYVGVNVKASACACFLLNLYRSNGQIN
jgi:hypothetical protein